MTENGSIPGKINLRDLSRPMLVELVRSLKLSEFRARQIFAWLYRPGIKSFSQMTDLAKSLRQELEEIAFIPELPLEAKDVSNDGTIKYGFRLHTGEIVEAVLIPDDGRNTLCISSQAGCAMGCQFCLTGSMGFRRNLSPAEIVFQVIFVRDELLKLEQKITNLVFMGMGEPLANFENLDCAITILLDQLGLNFSERRITVSTCGLVPKILELGRLHRVNLAISLHAPNNEIRSRIMPVNERYPIEELLEACRNYPIQKRKRIMFEYVLLAGINDSDDDARQLAKLLRGIPCKINLLPFNECASLPYKRPDKKRIRAFQAILIQADYTAPVRQSRGDDISAACGQLAGRHK